MIYHGEPLDLMPTLDLAETYPLLECTLSLTHPIDVARLKAAVATTQTVVPQVLGRYNLRWNRFEDAADSLDQVIEEIPAIHDPGRGNLDVLTGPQLKIQVIHHPAYDALRLSMSRLLTDGEGFKHYLYLLAAAYDGEDLANFINERSVRKILAHLRHPHRALPTLNGNSDETFPSLQGDVHHHRGEATIPRVVSRRLRQRTQTENVTMNAMLLSAYALSLFALTGEKQLIIPYQVDLRLHGPVAASNVVQVANLTSEMPIPITVEDGDRLGDVVQRTQATISRLRDELAYLPPLVELNRMSRALPPQLVRRLAEKHRPQAAISFANFGHIDHTRLDFGGVAVTQIYFAGAYRTMPHFQLTVSVYHDAWTLAFRMLGSEPDYQLGIKILKNVVAQLTQWGREDLPDNCRLADEG
ncbi:MULTISPECIES: condensation domain-containing protein [Levilactobacillus]|uniref:condensation domain-containing protein n=1 Tax=Levilactobacillus TaxID=2767886 RepID=UPI00194EABB1|nr:condensation domain-containing protein [Levilactobacillus sp. 244-2]